MAVGRRLAVRDLPGRDRALHRIEHLASHDTLTDLSNRAHFTDALDDAIDVGEPEPAPPAAGAAGGNVVMPSPSATRLASSSSMLRNCDTLRSRTGSSSTFDSSNTIADAMCACSIGVWLRQNIRGWL